MEQMDRAMDSLDSDLKSYDDHFKEIRIELATKLDRNDGKKIWDQFQRFCEYSDLKELYSKCIPELAKFEAKMVDHQTGYQRMEDIIARFDKLLTEKASKVSVKDFQDYVNRSFIKNDDQSNFIEKVQNQIDS
jgi:hypothetical protein